MSDTELRKAILKTATVSSGMVRFSQKQYSDGSTSPISSHSQDIVEIGIDDLMQLIAKHSASVASQHMHDCLLQYAETGTVGCYETAKNKYNEMYNKGLELTNQEGEDNE